MSAISIKNLHKTYSSGFVALKGVDLEIEKGDFFALLGPNGAGKSTIIGILNSLVRKTSGSVKIAGIDIDENFDLAKTKLGVVPQEFNFGIFEKVKDIITTQAGYYGIPKKEALENTDVLLKQLGLWEKKDVMARMLSGGMKRRLMIARALVHKPEILILDEPTAGVDVELRNSMWKYISELNKNGTTIILTTHYLEEAEELCKNIAIIDSGLILKNSSMKDLLKTSSKQTIILDIKDNLKIIPTIKKCQVSKVDENTLEIIFDSEKITLNEIFHELYGKKVIVNSMRNKQNRLEELFLEITKKKPESVPKEPIKNETIDTEKKEESTKEDNK
jgi:ABC-2 type transport system ATP-binding protein